MPPRVAHAHDGLAQRLVALGVEVGIRLVEHDQERIAVERARERDALRLPGRQRGAALADLGLVASGRPTIRSCTPAALAAAMTASGSAASVEARDVLRHGAGQQLDVLRQIADVLAERIRRPLIERGAVETDAAAHRPPDADQHARQRAICPMPLGPMMPRPLPACSGKLTSCTTIFCSPGGTTLTFSTDEASRRRLQRHRVRLRRQQREQLGQPLPALPRGDEAAPVGDREIDRRQRARAQDRAGDDDAGGRLLIDHEIGADARARPTAASCAAPCDSRAEAAGDVAGAALARQVLGVGLAPARGDAAGHAHGGQHFGVAAAGFGERRCAPWQSCVAARVGSRVMISVSSVMMPRMMAPTSAASPM